MQTVVSFDNFDDNFFGTYFQLVTCDIWDTDYNTDNWEPGFITIFVIALHSADGGQAENRTISTVSNSW